MGATNVAGRIASSLCKAGSVKPHFIGSTDVLNGGVMLAIPALLHCGLLSHIEKYFELPQGYYDVNSIMLSLAFSVLSRISSIEQLRFEPPGEWGKLLGVDRIPEVRVLREKIKLLAEDGKSKEWSAELSKDWLETLPEGSAALYVDGHVRVYYGEKHNIPKHYVPRIKLCLHAACDYWVNAMDGQPFFMMSQAADPGLIKTLENVIIPRLEETVSNQPSQKKLDNDPYLSRFTVVFDREGYSPDLMVRLWRKRISIKTYAKHPGEDWPLEEFKEWVAKFPWGEETTMQLAERGVYLRKKIWLREIRKLNSNGSQTTIYTTEYHTTTGEAASGMFSRWSQENFFKYMRKHYAIDSLISYSLDESPENVQVINPEYRRIDNKIRSLSATFGRHLKTYATLNIEDAIDPKKVERTLQKKHDLLDEIKKFEEKIDQLKGSRKSIKKHIEVKDLPEEEKIKLLSSSSKHLIDTIKIICYRAETAMALILKDNMSHKDQARSLLQAMYKNEADLVPNYEHKILTVRLHNLANRALSESMKPLLNELNATETIFPGTDLRLVYELI